jgi:hypothetical protein
MVNIENTVGAGLVPTHIVIASPHKSGRGNLFAPPRLLRRLRLLATTGKSTGLCNCPIYQALLLEFLRFG